MLQGISTASPNIAGTVGAFIELHAVKAPEGEPVHNARNADGNGEEEIYAAACRLAEMVGIDLEDG